MKAASVWTSRALNRQCAVRVHVLVPEAKHSTSA